MFTMGTANNPQGRAISVDSISLRRDGKPWLARMGEIHYSRYPQPEWRDALLAMKAGGLDVIASYVFWIHHEEIEGKFDFTGQRDLRTFVQTCGELDLPIIVRCGPWCHGEVRNGGLPDWILPLGKRLRTEDPQFMEKTRVLYGQIAAQLKGLLWKDGGPVIGIQLDNEYWGPAEYLLALKRLAREVGLDVPIYTRTGWPDLTTPMPPGEMLPLYGAYAEGFWDHSLEAMPGNYWRAYRFEPTRTDTAVATDHFGQRTDSPDPEAALYPYLTCELGGGMMCSYHRRIRIDPRDIATVALVKVGSGSNLPGYYMYHGGTNPDGALSTLNETQATDYPNDLPVKSYDFLAPLGEFGQVRPHYHLLRRLHLFLHDFGQSLSQMKAYFPRKLPIDGRDAQTLRYAVRTDGQSGFLFVNNYHRLLPMPAKTDAKFDLSEAGLTSPFEPMTIPADCSFILPINLKLGEATLRYATAQLVCSVAHEGKLHVVFAQIPGIEPKFVLDDPKDAEKVKIILLNENESLTCHRATLGGIERILLSRAQVLVDGEEIRLVSENADDLSVAIFPPLEDPPANVRATWEGLFTRYTPEYRAAAMPGLTVKQIADAAASRDVKRGKRKNAEMPSDSDFDQAAVWEIQIDSPSDRKFLLRTLYSGDCARYELNGRLLTDHFYNGTEFDLGLWRISLSPGDRLLLKILPLGKDAPIHITPGYEPDFADKDSVLKLHSIELVELHHAKC